LKYVTIPNAYTVGDAAFSYCYSSLAGVYFSQNAPAEADDVYTSTPNVTNYVTSPTATGWTNSWNGRPVVRLPVYADNFYGSGTGITGITAAQVGALSNNQQGVVLGLASGTTAARPLETNHVATKKYVDDLLSASAIFYVSSNTIITGDGKTNFVYVTPPPPVSGSRTYTAPTNGQYVGDSIVTNLNGFSTPITVSSYQGISSTSGKSMSNCAEFYYSIDGGTNWLGDWESESRTLTTGSNQYDYTIIVVPYSGPCMVKRSLKVTATSGSPDFTIYYGSNNPSSIAFSTPGVESTYTLTAAKIAAAGGNTNDASTLSSGTFPSERFAAGGASGSVARLVSVGPPAIWEWVTLAGDGIDGATATNIAQGVVAVLTNGCASGTDLSGSVFSNGLVRTVGTAFTATGTNAVRGVIAEPGTTTTNLTFWTGTAAAYAALTTTNASCLYFTY
jgi:hypothetical protein